MGYSSVLWNISQTIVRVIVFIRLKFSKKKVFFKEKKNAHA